VIIPPIAIEIGIAKVSDLSQDTQIEIEEGIKRNQPQVQVRHLNISTNEKYIQ
jgi:hypothetical protein